mmetsp:Transcript_60035/g.127151  ORF Transcript_60035/g.127151 Transcript_60035/m.127151 type:complete len:852 (-) Transcript_60035:56-2611(-)
MTMTDVKEGKGYRAMDKLLVEDSENHNVLIGRVPLLAEDLELDDKDVTWVFVLSRSQEEGGIVDMEADRRDPKAAAQRIFFMPPDFYPLHFDLLEQFDEDPMAEGTYQEKIRRTFLALLQAGGMKAHSSQSIDHDEVFLKVSMLRDSERLQRVAGYYRYKMPVRADVHQRLVNDIGKEVPIYLEFDEEYANKLEPFRQIDEMRLIMRWLCERVNVEEMVRQQILVGIFPAARYRQIKALSSDWANPWHVHLPARDHHAQDVRDYLGEQIAFFFLWFQSYKKGLFFLALASLAVFLARSLDLGSFSKWIPNFFVIYLTLWVVVFNERFKRKTSRYAQVWGMKDWDSEQASSLASYDPEMDGTTRGSLWAMASQAVIIGYLVFFASAILGISALNGEMRMNNDMRLAVWQPYIVSILMKICSFVWSKLAIIVVGWQNHRTKLRFDDDLARTLSSVKLFVALFPFFQVAFLEAWVNQTCSGTLLEAAAQVYEFTGWPPGSPPALMGMSASANSTVTAAELSFLDQYVWHNETGMVCIEGCYPISCEAIEGTFVCRDLCEDNIETQLVSFYGLQVLSAVVFLIIPIILTKVAVASEIVKVRGDGGCWAILKSLFGCTQSEMESDEEESELGSGEGRHYSLLQYQAKCHSYAPYEYASWGGSFVEDFLDVAIGYALLACFSQLKPMMVTVGVLSHFVIYRILAYRMLNVTCRPMAWGAEGIGVWQEIMGTIATLAVTCNVALSTFFMTPIKHWSTETKFLFFIVAEKALFSLRSFVELVVKDQPDDVTRIYDKYEEAQKILTTHPLGASPKSYDFSHVDIGLEDFGGSSSSSESPRELTSHQGAARRIRSNGNSME